MTISAIDNRDVKNDLPLIENQTNADAQIQEAAQKVLAANAEQAQLPAPKEIAQEIVKIEAPKKQTEVAPAPVAQPAAPVEVKAEVAQAPVAQPAKLSEHDQLKITRQKDKDALAAAKKSGVSKEVMKQLVKADEASHKALKKYNNKHRH